MTSLKAIGRRVSADKVQRIVNIVNSCVSSKFGIITWVKAAQIEPRPSITEEISETEDFLFYKMGCLARSIAMQLLIRL